MTEPICHITDAVLFAIKQEEYANHNINLGLPDESREIAKIAAIAAFVLDRQRIVDWLDSLYQCDGIIEMTAIDLAEAILRGDHWGKNT